MRITLVGSVVAAVVAANLAACDSLRQLSAVKTEMAGEPGSTPDKLPPPGPPADFAGSLCSFEESQRLTVLLEKAHAARVRELADAKNAAALTVVPMRLSYDEKGQISKAAPRLDGNMEFVAALAVEAKAWRLEGITQAGTCDVAIRIAATAPPAPGPPP